MLIRNTFGYFFHRKGYELLLTKNALGYILGVFFTNSSGHPAPNCWIIPPHFTKNETVSGLKRKKLSMTVSQNSPDWQGVCSALRSQYFSDSHSVIGLNIIEVFVYINAYRHVVMVDLHKSTKYFRLVRLTLFRYITLSVRIKVRKPSGASTTYVHTYHVDPSFSNRMFLHLLY
jgi:hypothetical protein